MPIEEFADTNGLDLHVYESSVYGKPNYTVGFINCHYIWNNIKCSMPFGFGETKELAISDFCKKISNKTIDIANKNRVKVPLLEFDSSIS